MFIDFVSCIEVSGKTGLCVDGQHACPSMTGQSWAFSMHAGTIQPHGSFGSRTATVATRVESHGQGGGQETKGPRDRLGTLVGCGQRLCETGV